MSEFTIPDAERMLEASVDHRVLKRVPPVIGWPLAHTDGATRRALFIDIRATGKNTGRDQIIALGSVAFAYDAATGAMVEAEEPRSVEDPDAAALEALTKDIDLFVAHQAGFVRPLMETVSPLFLNTNWACSYDEINWADEGLWSARVPDLLAHFGWFEDHVDVASHARCGAFLLSLPLPRSGRTVLQTLLAHARRPLMAVRATGLSWKQREAMKQRGFHWDNGSSGSDPAWFIVTETPEVEIAWLNNEIYSKPREITPIPMPASRRYSSRPWH